MKKSLVSILSWIGMILVAPLGTTGAVPPVDCTVVEGSVSFSGVGQTLSTCSATEAPTHPTVALSQGGVPTFPPLMFPPGPFASTPGPVTFFEFRLIPTFTHTTDITFDLFALQWEGGLVSALSFPAVVTTQIEIADEIRDGIPYTAWDRLLLGETLNLGPLGRRPYPLPPVSPSGTTGSISWSDYEGRQLSLCLSPLTPTPSPYYIDGSGVLVNYTASFCFHITDFMGLADFNSSGSVSQQDIYSFLDSWFASDPRADINGDTLISLDDLFAFLSLYFSA